MPEKNPLSNALALAIAAANSTPLAAEQTPTDQVVVVEPVEIAPAKTEVKDESPKADDSLATFLKSELSASKLSLSELNTKLAASELALASAKAEHTALLARCPEKLETIVRGNIKSLIVPMNAVVIGLDTMQGESLILAWDQMNKQFSETFVPGQKSIASTPQTSGAGTQKTALKPTSATRLQ